MNTENTTNTANPKQMPWEVLNLDPTSIPDLDISTLRYHLSSYAPEHKAAITSIKKIEAKLWLLTGTPPDSITTPDKPVTALTVESWEAMGGRGYDGKPALPALPTPNFNIPDNTFKTVTKETTMIPQTDTVIANAKTLAASLGNGSPVNSNPAIDTALDALKFALLNNHSNNGAAVNKDQLEQLETKLKSYIQTELNQYKKVEYNFNFKEFTKVSTASYHFKTPLILAILQTDIPIALVGPAGTGKTTIGKQCSETLNLSFFPQSFNILSTKADILGFKDANGVFQETLFFKAFTNGGIFLADEFDACNAGVATILNAAIANRLCSFADGNVYEAHKDFKYLCCMNTFGTGATAEYVGRNRLDAATLDRFAYIEIPPDDQLERELLGLPRIDNSINLSPCKTTPTDWLNTVIRFRTAAQRLNLKHIISQRASINGSKLLGVVNHKLLKDMLLFKGLSETDRKNLITEADKY